MNQSDELPTYHYLIVRCFIQFHGSEHMIFLFERGLLQKPFNKLLSTKFMTSNYCERGNAYATLQNRLTQKIIKSDVIEFIVRKIFQKTF